ncbi:MAG: calcium-transporting P-type ATPase, PMR1-type [Candidatus Hydrothermarchaeales archaeon]
MSISGKETERGDAYLKPVETVLSDLGTSPQGLANDEAAERLIEFGHNELKERKKITPLGLLIRQFANLFIVLLLASAAISAFLGNMHDAIAIAIAVTIVAVLGFIQEYKSEKSIEALQKLTPQVVHIIRGGESQEAPARELVPGDIVVLRVGDRISADARVIDVTDLEVDESILTGESKPIRKNVEAISKKVTISKKLNMIYSGTVVTNGNGKAVVVETGIQTELGKISEMIQGVEEKQTPLQIKLDDFGKQLSLWALFICVFVFAAGVFTKVGTYLEMFTVAVALAVAAIPEGLPIVVTITLALGVTRMARRNAIVRRLPAVETLGSTTVICSDKTGTLTQNAMTVQKIFTSELFDVTGVGYETNGRILRERKTSAEEDLHLQELLKISVLCNNAEISNNDEETKIIGQPTEGALLTAALKGGLNYTPVRKDYERIQEFPFDSVKKSMSTIHITPDGRRIAYVKGGVGIVLPKSTQVHSKNGKSAMDEAYRKRIHEVHDQFASKSLRVLAFAYKELPEKEEYTREEIEKDLVFVGMMGIMDPPRRGVKKAIEKTMRTGVKIVMITGDAKETAIAIAKDLNIFKEGDLAVSGQELDTMSDEDFGTIVEKTSVYSRVLPEHKMRIVQALKSNGHVVAMTGDGVNDAPALKSSDIGIAMGKTGADVTKEAADLILVDDNFVTIINAIEEGKSIYNNIKHFLRFQLTTNVAALATIGTSTLMGLPLPLNTLQILWVNIIMDGPPAQSLSMEPTDPEVMKRPPRDPNENIVSKKMVIRITFISLIMFVGTLGLFIWVLSQGAEVIKARTMAFTVFVMFQMFNAFNCRSEDKSFFSLGVFSNKYVIMAVVGSVLVQVAVVHVAILQNAFHTVGLSLSEWLLVTGIGSTAFLADEIRKRIV